MYLHVCRWYHPGITRHIAECLLLSREIKDGTYLLRESGGTLALSVRCPVCMFNLVLCTYMYRLCHKVEVSTWFTHQGPEAWGCVNHIETDTKWYNWLVVWATWPWQCIYILATIASAIKGWSAYLAMVWTIVADHRWSNHAWHWKQ